MHHGKPIALDGNQIASLCLQHVCHALSKQGRMPKKPACIKTVVTTEMLHTISQAYGVACVDTLTGFKWIASMIHRWEQEKEAIFTISSQQSAERKVADVKARDEGIASAISEERSLTDALCSRRDAGLRLFARQTDRHR